MPLKWSYAEIRKPETAVESNDTRLMDWVACDLECVPTENQIHLKLELIVIGKKPHRIALFPSFFPLELMKVAIAIGMYLLLQE